jgi:hypothetical protein
MGDHGVIEWKQPIDCSAIAYETGHYHAAGQQVAAKRCQTHADHGYSHCE